MTTMTTLTVPAPGDGVDGIEDAVGQIRAATVEMEMLLSPYAAAGVLGPGIWVGEAAGAYAAGHAEGRVALERIGRSHGALHGQLERYREASAHAELISTGARSRIGERLAAYGVSAGAATNALADSVDRVLSDLGRTLSEALTDPLKALSSIPGDLADALDIGGQVAASLRAWVMPPVEVILEPIDAFVPAAPGESAIRGWLQSAGGLASDAAAGIEGLFAWGEGVLAAGLADLSRLEDDLVAEIAAVELSVVAELESRERIGDQIADEIVLTAQHELNITWELATQIPPALLSIALLLAEHDPLDPLSLVDREGRRLSSAPLLDHEDAERFFTDGSLQAYVDGMRLLSGSAYQDSGAPHGWTRIDSIPGPDGGYAAVFRNTAGKTVVAFRGTQPASLRDDVDDAENSAGLPTAQAQWAIQVAEKYRTATFTGHSLGGSLAATASIATGQKAYTFNASGIDDPDYAEAEKAAAALHVPVDETKITNFHTTNDIVTNAQSIVGLRPAAGVYVTIPSTVPGVGNSIAAHSLSSFDWDGLRRAPGDKE